MKVWSKLPARERREQRRREAAERQAAHDATPGFDKIAKTMERPGLSVRERTRILCSA